MYLDCILYKVNKLYTVLLNYYNQAVNLNGMVQTTFTESLMIGQTKQSVMQSLIILKHSAASL